MRGITIYSKNTGLEILANDKEKGNNKYGVITLRFFKLDGSGRIRFLLNPIETYGVSNFIKSLSVATSNAKKTLTHKFGKEGEEITTSLILEKWERDGKVGYAISIKRENMSINVPMDTNTFCYLSELFRYLSVQQAWVNPIEKAVGTDETILETEELPTEVDTKETGVVNVTEDYTEDSVEDTIEELPSDIKVTKGIIEAVRKDGKGFKLAGVWFSLQPNSIVNAELVRNKKISLSYETKNNTNYILSIANA